MNRHDLPEDLQDVRRGVLMNVLGIDPLPARQRPAPSWLPEHLSLDPFDPEQADSWSAAVEKHEASR